MREIKFRAWHKHRKEMFNIKEVFFYESTHEYQGVKDMNEDLIHKDECILMQYIGRKDNNGVEIYEDNVVLWNPGHSEGIGQVFFDEGCFKHSFLELLDGKPNGYRPAKRMWNVVEVIGNIHENPELLKLLKEEK